MDNQVVSGICRFFFLAMVSAFALKVNAQTVEYIHTDALGTPVAITDSVGNIVERSEYEPYGQLVNRVLTDGPGFAGHLQDAATGLTYMQQRYYDPLIGRFLSTDPVTAYSNSGANFNRFWYANNNPYRFMDPDGRLAQENVPSRTEDEPLPLPPITVTPSPPPATTTVATVTVIGIRPEPIPQFRPIPWAVLGEGISATAGAVIMAPFLFFFSPHPCGEAPCGELRQLSGSFPPGFWPGDAGAAEWGKRNGYTPKEGKDKFHRGVKEHTLGTRGDHDFGVNPDTGEVVDQNGESVGNLNDE
ncbi:RHS repeat domain-containing protein [Pseudoxanthomonas beigongshangi]